MAGWPRGGPVSRRTRVGWLVCGLASALAFVLVALLVLRTSPGGTVDRWASRVVLDGLPSVLRRGLDALARPWLLVALAPVDVVLALLAVVRRGWRRVCVAVLVVVVSATVTAGLDVPALLHLPGDGYPSDHATVGFALVGGDAANVRLEARAPSELRSAARSEAD